MFFIFFTTILSILYVCKLVRGYCLLMRTWQCNLLSLC